MLKEGLVSVIIPTYNRAKIVLRAIESVLEQTYKNIEVIVVSDGPSPKTKENVLNIDDNRVVYYEKDINEGVSSCRNYGIEKANGRWIALLDDDDYWESQKLELQLSLVEDNEEDEIILSGKEEIIFDKTKNRILPEKLPERNEDIIDYLFSIKNEKSTGAHTSTIMASSEIFRKVKFNENLERHEDWQWLIDVNKEFEPSLISVPEIIAYQREHISGLGRAGGFSYTKKWYQNNLDVFSKEARAGLISGVLCRKASYDLKINEIPWLIKELNETGYLNLYSIYKLFFHWFMRPSIKSFLKRWFLN